LRIENLEVAINAPAKINLTLDIIGKRSDGYHNIESVFCAVSLCDSVQVRLCKGGGLDVNCRFVPLDNFSKAVKLDGFEFFIGVSETYPETALAALSGNNLAKKAAEAFFSVTRIVNPGLEITIEKRIPLSAGLGGGSSDAANLLLGLNRLWGNPLNISELVSVAAKLGSDVPFFIFGGTALISGTGESVESLPSLRHCCVLLVKNGLKRSTAAMYAKLDEQWTQDNGRLAVGNGEWRIESGQIHNNCPLPRTQVAVEALRTGNLTALCKSVGNAFAPLWENSSVPHICRLLLENGARCASLTGSGPTVFGLFDDRQAAKKCFDLMLAQSSDFVFLGEPM
jgi:4-diphosphocytidyl-2-C-methyl-D-erythritol kinase